MTFYRPLSRERSEIRLIRFTENVDAKSDSGQLHLELRHVFLDYVTDFSALSYTWGDQRSFRQIKIKGDLIEIGNNLHAALMQLRRNEVWSWLWIDSICIRQSDPQEKAWQVGQMHRIFSQADLIYIWLGSGCGKTDRVMDFVSRFGQEALSAAALGLWSDWQRREEICDFLNSLALSSQETQQTNSIQTVVGSRLAWFVFRLLNEPGLQPNKNPEGENVVPSLSIGITNLMQRSYWHRIWIVQEISLAKDAIVLCGKKSVSLNMFDAVFTAVSHCIRSGFRNILPKTKSFGYGLKANFYINLPLSTRRNYRLDQTHISLGQILIQYGVAPQRPFYSASDPRDIVFGLLGIVTGKEVLGLTIDYTMTTSEVFTRLTRALVQDGDERSGIFHLDKCVPKSSTSPILSLPSWVPDWREIGEYGIQIHPINYHKAFDASAGMPVQPFAIHYNQSNILGRLCRFGCQVDLITQVMKPPEWEAADKWSALYIVDEQGWLDSILEFTELGKESCPGEDYVWRTVMRDYFDGINRPNKNEPKPINEDIALLIRKLMRRERIDSRHLTTDQIEYVRTGVYNFAHVGLDLNSLDDQLLFLEKDWPNAIGSVNRGRTLFKTVKGMLGLGHLAVQVGDVVTLLKGVKSPLILRPQKDFDGAFTFVGDAYVDGIMNGEFLQTSPVFKVFDID